MKQMVLEKANPFLNRNLREISPMCFHGEGDMGCSERWDPTIDHDKYANEDQTVICYKIHADS